jgi:hypothetical protein
VTLRLEFQILKEKIRTDASAASGCTEFLRSKSSALPPYSYGTAPEEGTEGARQHARYFDEPSNRWNHSR